MKESHMNHVLFLISTIGIASAMDSLTYMEDKLSTYAAQHKRLTESATKKRGRLFDADDEQEILSKARGVGRILTLPSSVTELDSEIAMHHAPTRILHSEVLGIENKCRSLSTYVQQQMAPSFLDDTPSKITGCVISPERTTTDVSSTSILGNTWIFPKAAFSIGFLTILDPKTSESNLQKMTKGKAPCFLMPDGTIESAEAHHIQQQPTKSTIFVLPKSHHKKALHHKNVKKSIINRKIFNKERKLCYKRHAYTLLTEHMRLKKTGALGTNTSTASAPLKKKKLF
jgi:hypothetical protein